MTDYRVVLVGDDDLPEGVNWAVGCTPRGGMFAFLKRTRVCSEVLEEAWAAADEVGGAVRLPLERADS